LIILQLICTCKRNYINSLSYIAHF